MFDHLRIGGGDHAASQAFFLAALEPPGVTVVSEGCRPAASNSAERPVFALPAPTDGKPVHLLAMPGHSTQVSSRGSLRVEGKRVDRSSVAVQQ
nr:hypothetical protein [Roseateles saccharophilus]